MKKIKNGGLLIGIPALAVLFFFINPGEHQIFPQCIFYSLTGYHCPGCGSQRAIHNLLHLNIPGVVHHNILFIPALLAIAYHYLHSVLNQKFQLKLPNLFYMKNFPWIVLGFVLAFWVLRNLPVFPFNALAPN
jgi:hypothetical protein